METPAQIKLIQPRGNDLDQHVLLPRLTSSPACTSAGKSSSLSPSPCS